MKRYIGGVLGMSLWLSAMLTMAAAEDPTKRSALSMVEVHDQFFAVLKPDAGKQFYCLRGFAGSRYHKDGNKPAWHIHVADDAGVRMAATVPADGDGKGDIRGERPPPKLHPGVKSLTELESLIASYRKLPKEAEIRQVDGIVVQYKTRKFFVHEIQLPGDYSQTCKEVIGPRPDGFVMRVREVKRGEPGQQQPNFDRSYWSTAKRYFPGFTPESEIVVEIDYAKRPEALDMFNAVGTNGCEHPAPMRPSFLLPKACELALAALSEQERERYHVRFAHARSVGFTYDRNAEWVIRLEADNQDSIQIDLDRDAQVIKRHDRAWPSEMKPKIRSVAEAEKVIPELLKSLDVQGTVKREGNKLSLEINPRTFYDHRELEYQVYADEIQEVRGPGLGGFFLTIEEVEFAGELKALLEKDKFPWLKSTSRGPLRSSRVVCKTDDDSRVLIVEQVSGIGSEKVSNEFFGRFEPWKP